jgi:hypothetical protein
VISVELFLHQHGACDPVAVEGMTFPHRSPSWDFDALAQRFEPGQARRGVAWARGMRDETRHTRAASASASTRRELSAADERHLGGHHREEEHVDIEAEARHVRHGPAHL